MAPHQASRRLTHNWHTLVPTRADLPSNLDGVEATHTRWPDERLDDLKGSVDHLSDRIDSLQHAMIVAVVAMCSTMFAGFGALITLFAIRF